MLTEKPPSSTDLSKTVTIGALLDLTGELAAYSQDNVQTVEKAILDFNNNLKAKGENWTLALQIEDTKSDPDVALEKLKQLDEAGINLVVGIESSDELANLKEYADEHNILLISPFSTAPFLAVADDSILRFALDDTKQAYAIARLMINEGITEIATIWRGNMWGQELESYTTRYFKDLGGHVEGSVRYNHLKTGNFSYEIQKLAQWANSMVDRVGPEKAAILYIGFSETAQIFNEASQFEVLSQVRSFGTDGAFGIEEITQNPTTSQFAEKTKYLSPIISTPETAKSAEVESHFTNPLSTYALGLYDSVWAVGLAIQRGQSSDTEMVKALVPVILSGYEGALGEIRLNVAGDIEEGNYQFCTVESGKWVEYTVYSAATDEFLKYFGLYSLSDLPKPREIEEIMKDEDFIEQKQKIMMNAIEENLEKSTPELNDDPTE
jgi:branched-chain amino acid transport system substrate-binding protein